MQRSRADILKFCLFRFVFGKIPGLALVKFLVDAISYLHRVTNDLAELPCLIVLRSQVTGDARTIFQ
ncbi:hypothetical protein D3C83_43940 [compost metagenome]